MHSLVIFLLAICSPTVWLMDQKALDEFVKLPDSYYGFTFQERNFVSLLGLPVNLDTINMTSQKWLDESEVDKPVWSHKLLIVVPQRVKLAKSCLLIIRPDQNKFILSEPFSKSDLFLSATATRSIVAVLKPVPFQPLTFYNHPLGHKDITGYDIVAYSWWKFMNDPTAPPHWLAQFPMVKATVRAMDTIVNYMKKEYRTNIRKFTLTGVSLGGWISWLTAAVDQRVEAIVPIAMDFLNFTESFHHQYQAYCGWSYMLRPFYELNLTRELDSPRFCDLASHVDPLAYNERFTNTTKYIIVLSGDELFQPDNWRYYFSQLQGAKYLQIIPNSDSRLQVKDRLMNYILALYIKMVQKEYGLPKVSWEIEMTNTTATILVKTYHAYRVYAYYADMVGARRDFRMKIAAGDSSQDRPVNWIQTDVKEVERNVYKKEMSKPEEGWRGFFLQVIYVAEKLRAHFIITSDVLILPDTFPCPDCNGDECHGTVV